MVLQILGSLKDRPQAKAEIASHLGRTKPSRYLHELMAKLIQCNRVEYTLPGKPNSRLQKYRLTAQGRAWLSRHPH